MGVRKFNRRVIELTGGIVGKLTDEQLGLDTRCAGWTVREVIEHMVVNNRKVLAQLQGEGGPAYDSGDLRADFLDSEEALADAFDDDEVLGKAYVFRGQDLPGSVGLSVHFMDVLVHGSDIGAALGVDVEIDDDLADAAYKLVSQFPEDLWGPEGIFSEKLPEGSDASAQQRLLAITGRVSA